MRLNQNPNLRSEDFPEQNSWISKLFIQLNPFFSSLNQILNLNLDFATNIKSLTADYSTDFQGTFQDIVFLWPFTDDIPRDLRITQANQGTSQDPVILLPAWEFDSERRQIRITQILQMKTTGNSEVSGRYQFKVRVTV